MSIKYKDTSQLFWNTYPYKVEVNLWKKFIDIQHLKAFPKLRYDDYVNKKTVWKNELIDLCSKYKLRDNNRRISFFFLNETDCDNFLSQVNYVSEIHKPRNDAALKAMQEDPLLIMRDKLYHDKYRWSIKINSKNDDTFHNWKDSYFPEEENHSDRFYYFWDKSSVFYVNDENDVLLIKMGMNDCIKKIEYVKLYSEL